MAKLDAKLLLSAIMAVGLAITYGPVYVTIPGIPTAKVRSLPAELFGPSRKLEGSLESNTDLWKATVLFQDNILYSETILPAADGSEITLIDRYGAIFTASLDAKAPGGYSLSAPWATHLPKAGRALGFVKDGQGNLVVAHMNGGLVRVERGAGDGGSDRVVVLASRVSQDSALTPNTPIMFANDLSISPTTGVIYFTDSSNLPAPVAYPAKNKEPFFDTLLAFLQTFFSGSITGRLLAYYPETGKTHVLATGMWYANGVALSQDESFVAITETLRFRVLRYWLKGPKAGTTDVLIDGLPGFPDGIDTAPDGGFWIAMPAQRTSSFELLKTKLGRSIAAWLPFTPPLDKWGAVLKVSPSGEILRFLVDPDGSHMGYITAAEEAAAPGGRGTRLYMGSLMDPKIAYLDL